MTRPLPWVLAAGLALGAVQLHAQAQVPAFDTNDPVLRRIWQEGMGNSQVERLGHTLMDSLGPRLTGTPSMQAAQAWLLRTYAGWGIDASNREYGTWRSWRRGHTHADLLAPRARSLEATLLAWSPGTQGAVTGGVVAIPRVASAAEFEAWLPSVQGKFVLVSFPEPTCRPDENWQKWARPADFESMKLARARADSAWTRRVQATGLNARTLPARLEAAGAAGILTSFWSEGWGVQRIFNARTTRVPTLDVSCEDYGLLYRLADSGAEPRIRVDAAAEDLGMVPVANTMAEMRGRRLPDEYVMLSAHFDSWDGASGATDNATGTLVMLEAMRLLKLAYPQPKRTILVGHWSGEEQGLIGSRAFVRDNPRVVSGLQALFNQDNGTGRIASISMQGFTEVSPFVQRWLTRVPPSLAGEIKLDDPGVPSQGGSDYASFVCAGAPAFGLSSLSWDYGTYTWHTNRDTYDKISWEDVRTNAVLTAMLVYLASEEGTKLPRTQRTTFPNNPFTGQPYVWPTCNTPRTWEDYTR
jgi:carboxypeptidase Q